MLHADEEWFCKMAWQHLAASRRKPDIVHAHALHQTARLKTIDVPVAVNLPGEPNPRYVGDLQLADVLLSDGWGARKLPAILGRPVEHITKGVDAALFTPEGPSIRSSLGVGSSPVALVVSRLVPIKNVALFVDAMAVAHRDHPDARAVIVGDGPLDAALRQRAAALGLERVVQFAGYIAQRDLPRWYRAADVLVLPSDFDNSPNVVLEAMACGLPIVATDVGGVAEFVVADRGGSLVSRGDAAGMADAITRWLTDAGRGADASAANRRLVRERYSWRASAERLLEVYRDVLDRRRTATRRSA
jgi:glycosyltransferase involved in cell wall biosynthesis